MRKFYVIGISLLALFAFSAVAASSASAEGPWWIIKNSTTLFKLEKLSTEKILGENDEVPFLLLGMLANVECAEMKYTGNLIGNNPGMDLEELKFGKCNVEGLPNCLAENAGAGLINANVFTILTYGNDSTEKEVLTLALDAFFPDNKTLGTDTFTEFTLKEVAGTSGCGLLNGTKVVVTATGSPELGEVGEPGDKETVNKKCGVLGEVGLLEMSAFKETVSGEERTEGALSTEKVGGPIETLAWMLNIGSTNETRLVACTLAALGGTASELGIATADLESGFAFGWESD